MDARTTPARGSPAAPRRPTALVGGATAVIAIILLVGVGRLRSLAARSARDTAASLRSVARQRATAIEALVGLRMNDGRLLAANDAVMRALDPRLPPVTRNAERAASMTVLRATMRTLGIHQARIVDGGQRTVAAYPPGEPALDAGEEVALSLERGRARVVPAARATAGPLLYGVTVPVFPAGDSTRPPLGVIVLERDVANDIAAALATGAGPPASLETVALQLRGDTAMVLHTSRNATADSLARPLSLRDSAHVVTRLLAAIDTGGHAREGLDDRRVSVLGALVRVNGTPWAVLATVERDEAVAPMRAASAMIALVMLLLSALVALVALQLWQRRQRAWAAAEAVRSRRVVQAVRGSDDGYVVLDRTGRIVEANEALATITGFAIPELLTRSLADLEATDQPVATTGPLERFRRGGAGRGVHRWRRNDGRFIEVDASATAVTAESGEQVALLLRDVTVELAARRRLERLDRLHTFLARMNERLFLSTSREAAFAAICEVAVRDGAFRLAWVGIHDDTAGIVRPVAWHGAATEYIRQSRDTTDPDLPTSRGPASRAMREAQPVILNDFASSPDTAPWHELARDHGFAALASMPLFIRGRVGAVITFYAAEAGFFEPDLLALLQEIVRFLGLVIESIDAAPRLRDDAERRR